MIKNKIFNFENVYLRLKKFKVIQNKLIYDFL